MPGHKGNPILLLTGFEPFGRFDENPSWIAAAEVRDRLNGSVKAVRPPVDHLESRRQLIAALEEIKPLACLCMGLVPSDEFRLEQLARKPRQFAGFVGEPKLTGTWPWSETEQVLQQHQILHRRSCDAGEYVCESTYWTLLDFASSHRAGMHAGFLHVPAICPRCPVQATTEVLYMVASAYCEMHLPMSEVRVKGPTQHRESKSSRGHLR